MTVIEIGAGRDQASEVQPPAAAEIPADAGAEEVLWVDPRELIIGDNVRLDAGLERGFVADIAERGVRQIIPVRREESGRLVVRTGQRRVLAAIEAGLVRVRVLVETEELTDERAQSIDRTLDQLGENEHRSALSDAEEAQATQLLLGLGLSARQIARRRHIPAKRVATAAAVARNPLALDALREGVLDLGQAAVIAEFAGDEAALTSAAAQRPEQFAHVAQQLRDAREETRRRAELTATLTGQGCGSSTVRRSCSVTGSADSRSCGPAWTPSRALSSPPVTTPGVPGMRRFSVSVPGGRWPSGSARCLCAPTSRPRARRAPHLPGGQHHRQSHRGDD